MIIQINSDHNLHVHEAFGEKIESLLTKELDRFTEHITRLEVHMSDENGNKKGVDDKKCLLEARLEGRQPIAVTEASHNYEIAVKGAAEKLKNTLDKILDKKRNH